MVLLRPPRAEEPNDEGLSGWSSETGFVSLDSAASSVGSLEVVLSRLPRAEEPNEEAFTKFCAELVVAEVVTEDVVLVFSSVAVSGSDKDSDMGRQYIRFAK